MKPPALTEEEEAALAEELSAALEEMVNRSCPDMAPLWLETTRRARGNLGPNVIDMLGFEPSQRYLALGKSSRSKYRQLAAWRHAVLWQQVLPQVDDQDYADATAAVYFTPYPDNAPPYAWSRGAADAPAVARFASPSTLKEWAKEGCWHTVQRLRGIVGRLQEDGSWHAEVRERLLRPAVRETLRDVLKLEEHWE